MDHAQEQERLFETERYIAEANSLIARQRAVLERTARWGHPLDAAHATLDALESSLRMFENNRQRIHMMRKAARAIGEMKSKNPGAPAAGGRKPGLKSHPEVCPAQHPWSKLYG